MNAACTGSARSGKPILELCSPPTSFLLPSSPPHPPADVPLIALNPITHSHSSHPPPLVDSGTAESLEFDFSKGGVADLGQRSSSVHDLRRAGAEEPVSSEAAQRDAADAEMDRENGSRDGDTANGWMEEADLSAGGRELMTEARWSNGDVGLRDSEAAGPSHSHDKGGGIPVFVMLPLDVVTNEGQLRNPKALAVALQALKSTGVEGVMVDVWWGLVEKEGPKQYNWSPYKALLQMAKKADLYLQAVMSFHACGNNVGDNASIPLPPWVHDCASTDPPLYFTDRTGAANPECLSLFCDTEPCLLGRTPIQAYEDFMRGFKDAMGDDFGSTVCEVAIGMGPCGELRYPSYPEGDGRWRFPGIGEFQCYDARALADLKESAAAAGDAQWGLSGPHDAGHYNLLPHQTGFFYHLGSWDTPYGKFFLSWYSDALVKHQERMLAAAVRAFHGVDLETSRDDAWVPGEHGTGGAGAEAEAGMEGVYEAAAGAVRISMKCAGIHWWYASRAHAAELTAGYYNPRGRNGYDKIIRVCRRYAAGFNFTCIEMRNSEQPAEALCAPQELLSQVRVCAAQHGVAFAGENALARLDQSAYDQMAQNATSTSIMLCEVRDDAGTPGSNHAGGASGVQLVEYKVPPIHSLTFLRLTPQLFEERNFSRFMAFVQRLKAARVQKPSTNPMLPQQRKKSAAMNGSAEEERRRGRAATPGIESGMGLLGLRSGGPISGPVRTGEASPWLAQRGQFGVLQAQPRHARPTSAEFPPYLGARHHHHGLHQGHHHHHYLQQQQQHPQHQHQQQHQHPQRYHHPQHLQPQQHPHQQQLEEHQLQQQHQHPERLQQRPQQQSERQQHQQLQQQTQYHQQYANSYQHSAYHHGYTTGQPQQQGHQHHRQVQQQHPSQQRHSLSPTPKGSHSSWAHDRAPTHSRTSSPQPMSRRSYTLLHSQRSLNRDRPSSIEVTQYGPPADQSADSSPQGEA